MARSAVIREVESGNRPESMCFHSFEEIFSKDKVLDHPSSLHTNKHVVTSTTLSQSNPTCEDLHSRSFQVDEMFLFTSIFIVLLPLMIQSTEWSYADMPRWGRKNRYCAGHLQSPIDVRHSLSHYDRHLKPLTFHDRHVHEHFELINTGHTVQLNLNGSFLLKNVAPLMEDFKVEQLHFHWGRRPDVQNGSEHLLEGQTYPLEMHVVSYSTLYTSIREAMTNVRGLAVVGFFFELDDDINPLLQPFVDALANVAGPGDHHILDRRFNFKSMIGEERMHRYYRYDGSLTTPPCYESVLWTVVQEPIKLSRSQLDAFRSLRDKKSNTLENTYRKVQPLGSRILFRSFVHQNKDDETQAKIAQGQNHGNHLMVTMKFILLPLISGLLVNLFH